MGEITLRPKQDVKVLRAENDSKPQKVEVKRVVKDKPLSPLEIQRMQRQQAMTDEQLAIYNAQAARLGTPLPLGRGYGPMSQQQPMLSPLEILLRGY